MISNFIKLSRRVTFNRKKQQAFLEDFYSLVNDGVPATQSIETIRDISEGASKKVAVQILDCISRGQLIADGMEGWFSNAIVEVIRAGEMNGALLKTLRSAVDSFSEHSDAISSFLIALVYPLSVIVLSLIVVVFIKSSVLNSFAQIHPVRQWPGIGQTLYNLATIVQDLWWFILIVLFAVLFLVYQVLHYFTGEARKWIDSLPFLSLYRELVAARLMETLGLLVANGVVLKEALKSLQKDAAPYLSWHLLHMQYRLSGGKDNIAEVLDTDLIDRNDMIRLRVVSKGKGFEQALQSLGRQATSRNSKQIVLAGKILGGTLLVVGAMIAVLIVVGIYTVGSSLAT